MTDSLTETESEESEESDGNKKKEGVKQVNVKKAIGQKIQQYEIVHKVAKTIQEININDIKQQKKEYNQRLKEIFIESLNQTHNFHVMRDNFKIIESVL